MTRSSFRRRAAWCVFIVGCGRGDPAQFPPSMAADGQGTRAATSAVAPNSAPRSHREPPALQVALASERNDELFSFVPSITADGRLVALLVAGYPHGNYADQDLVIKSVADDQAIARFVLARVYDDGDDEALDQRQFARIRGKYRERADKANAWLSKHAWRALETCSGAGNDFKICPFPRDATSSIKDTIVAYDEPRLTVRCAGKVLVDRRNESWSYKTTYERCRAAYATRAVLGQVLIDSLESIVVVEPFFMSDLASRVDRDGCVVPLLDFHIVRLPRGTCQ